MQAAGSNPFEEAYQQATTTTAASTTHAAPPSQPAAAAYRRSGSAATATATTAPTTTTTPMTSSVSAARSYNNSISDDFALQQQQQQQQQQQRLVLAKFRVDVPFKGKQVLRPITYFPIYTEILVDNDARFVAPEVPNHGPHLRGIVLGVQRNDWTRGNCAMVERRYSEVHDLRELLVFQFPTLIIPPLPAKTGVGDVETYFNAGGAIATQRSNLQFFLREVAAMPAVMFFSEWTTPFFLDPRDSFETGTLVRMRAALQAFRGVSRSFYAFSQRHRSFAEDTATRIATTSTRVVRSIASLLWNDGGNGNGSGAGDTGSSSGSTGGSSVYATQGSSSNSNNSSSGGGSFATDASGGALYNFTTLPPHLREHAEAWLLVVQQLTRRQQALKLTARRFESYLLAAHAELKAQAKVNEALESGEVVLRDSACMTSLRQHCHDVVVALDEVAGKSRGIFDGKHVNVCMRLCYESNLIDAVLDAIDHVLCLFKAVHSAHVYDAHDQLYKDAAAYAEAVSRALHSDYVQRYQHYYLRRMRNLLMEQLVRPTLDVMHTVAATAHASSFASSSNNATAAAATTTTPPS